MNPANPVNRANVPPGNNPAGNNPAGNTPARSNPMGDNAASENMVTRPARMEEVPVTAGVSGMAALRDRVRWSSIWAGLIATLVVFLTLEVLAIALGLLTPLVTGTTANPGVVSAIVTAIVGIIAFFVGGWLAGATSPVRGIDAGVLDGLLVWALAVTLIFGLAILGLGSVFGVIGSILAQFLGAGRIITSPVPVSPGTVAGTTQAAAVGVFFSLLLSAVAAAIGGWVASLYDPIGHLFHAREIPERPVAPRARTRLPA